MIKIKTLAIIALCAISFSFIACAGGSSSSTSADIKPATTPSSSSTANITITLNANGGSINTTTVTEYTLPTAETLGLTRSGYTFIGWSTNQNATTVKYRDGGRVDSDDLNSDKTLTIYAIWRFGIKVTPDTVASVIGSLTEDSSIVITGTYNSSYETAIINAVKTSPKFVNLDFTPVSGSPLNFSNCTKLKKVTLSNAAQGSITVTGCSNLSEIVVNSENRNLYSSQGVLYFRDMTSLYVYPPAKTGTSFEVPAGVTTILSDAFKGNTNIQEVTFPSSLQNVFSGAFSGCTNLTSVNLPASTRWNWGSDSSPQIIASNESTSASNAAAKLKSGSRFALYTN